MSPAEATQDAAAFPPLPEPLNADGGPRRTGVEIELGGLDEACVAGICADHLGGRAAQDDHAIWRIDDSRVGKIKVYLDTALRNARQSALRDAALSLGRELIPVEIVTEPLDRDGLVRLESLRGELRRAGAIGSGGGLFFGFGVHLNIEIASDKAGAVVPPLLAYALIEDWLRATGPMDKTRRVLPFTAPYPAVLVDRLVDLGPDAAIGPVIDAYAADSPSRNHGLDMLPVFAHLDAPRVSGAVSGATSARPAFHFRLPDCRIDETDWSLNNEWLRWRLVERVTANRNSLSELSDAWRENRNSLNLTRGPWAERTGAILRDHGLANDNGPVG